MIHGSRLAAFVGAILFIATSACASESTDDTAPRQPSPETGPRSHIQDRREAGEFLDAISRYHREAQSSLREAAEIRLKQERSCASLSKQSDEELQGQITVVVHDFQAMIAAKLLAQEYLRLAETLERVRTQNPELRTVAHSTSIVAAEAAKLENADIDLCRLLREWRDTGWSRSFGSKLVDNGALVLFDIDLGAIVNANLAASATQPGLREVGLTYAEALEISTIAAYF